MEKTGNNVRFWRSQILRAFVLTILSFFVASNVVLPSFSGAVFAEERQSVGEFFDTYEREKDYQPGAEPIITPLPGFGGNVGGGAGGTGGYYNEQGQWIGEGNVSELEHFNVEEFEAEEAAKAAKSKNGKKQNTGQKATKKTGNWLVDSWNSATTWVNEKVVKPTVSTVKKVAKSVVSTVQTAVRSVASTVKTVASNMINTIKQSIEPHSFVSNNQIVFMDVLGFEVALPQFISQPFLPPRPTTPTGIKMQEIQDEYRIKMTEGKEKWTVKELEWLDETLAKTPPDFYDHNKLQEIIKDKENTAKEDSSCAYYYPVTLDITVTQHSYGCQVQDIDEKYNKDTPIDLIPESVKELTFKRIIIHEIHHSYQEKNLGIVDEFAKISFERNQTEVTIVEGNKVSKEKRTEWFPKEDSEGDFVTFYAGERQDSGTNPDGSYKVQYNPPVGKPGEDLSESVAMYMLKPDELKKASEEKYIFIKENLFEGKEYYEVNMLD